MQLESYQDHLNFNRGLTADREVIQQPLTDGSPGHAKDIDARHWAWVLRPRVNSLYNQMFYVSTATLMSSFLSELPDAAV